ncbi:MAG: hypothetical protein ABSG63_04430 [Spirochaetia bacterium]
MTEVFKKLNFKVQTPMLVMDAPGSFASELAAMARESEIHQKPKAGVRYDFLLAFAPMRKDLLAAAKLLSPLLGDAAVLWFAYPKQTSKLLKSDLNRDICWEALAHLGLQPVRQVAIDDDWSALRFKKKP